MCPARDRGFLELRCYKGRSLSDMRLLAAVQARLSLYLDGDTKKGSLCGSELISVSHKRRTKCGSTKSHTWLFYDCKKSSAHVTNTSVPNQGYYQCAISFTCAPRFYISEIAKPIALIFGM